MHDTVVNITSTLNTQQFHFSVPKTSKCLIRIWFIQYSHHVQVKNKVLIRVLVDTARKMLIESFY